MHNEAEVIAATLQVLAQRYADRFAEWGASPEQADAVLAQNWSKVMDDASRIYSAAMAERAGKVLAGGER